MASAEDRVAFAERIRLQMQSRYRGCTVSADPARFGLRVIAGGVDVTLSLSPLYDATVREPRRTASLIADFVAAAEAQLQARPGAGFSTARVLWCVRSRRYLDELRRADELLTRDVAGDLVAFAAEALPGSIMRGIPRCEWEARGHEDAGVVSAADRNTAERFHGVAAQIVGRDRVSAGGWSYSGDQLFASSLLVTPEVLRAFADRAGGDVYIAAPDRALVLAIPAAAPGADRFGRRVLQAFRDAMTPCSRDVLVTDGSNLRVVARAQGRRRGPSFLPWLDER